MLIELISVALIHCSNGFIYVEVEEWGCILRAFRIYKIKELGKYYYLKTFPIFSEHNQNIYSYLLRLFFMLDMSWMIQKLWVDSWQSKRYSVFWNCQSVPGYHTTSFAVGTEGSFFRVVRDIKWLGHEADHSPPLSAMAKKECSCIPPQPTIICLHDVWVENLPLFYCYFYLDCAP